MATYYGTYGQKVQYLASDPSDPQTGQVWYNSTSATLKVRQVTTAGTWASGGNLNTVRKSIGGAGTQTAALGFGGNPGSSPYLSNATESYNGTSWTTSPGTLNTSRGVPVSGGTQTSAIAAADDGNGVATETWNGSSWTSGPNLGSGIYYRSGTGTVNSAFAAGGSPTGTFNVSTTETWNGSSWTAGGSLVNPTAFAASVGTAADGLLISGGQASPSVFNNYTQKYNGSVWTSLAAVNTARKGAGASSPSPTSSAVIFGGITPSLTSATENWNGTSWTSNPNGLSTARQALGGVGTQTAALAFGGATPTPTGATEEWTGPGAGVTKTVTVS